MPQTLIDKKLLRTLFWSWRKIPGWLSQAWYLIAAQDWDLLEAWEDQLLRESKQIRKLEREHVLYCRKLQRTLLDSLFDPQDWDKVTGYPQRVTDEEVALAKTVSMPALLDLPEGSKIHCQWHEDTEPSMQVYLHNLYCFVCGKSCDQIEWIRLTRHMNFAEAVKHLCGDGV